MQETIAKSREVNIFLLTTLDSPKIKRKPENICHILFNKKVIKMINLPGIIYTINAKSSLVTRKCNFITPTVGYNWTSSIHSIIFNFTYFAHEFGISTGYLRGDTHIMSNLRGDWSGGVGGVEHKAKRRCYRTYGVGRIAPRL